MSRGAATTDAARFGGAFPKDVRVEGQKASSEIFGNRRLSIEPIYLAERFAQSLSPTASYKMDPGSIWLRSIMLGIGREMERDKRKAA